MSDTDTSTKGVGGRGEEDENMEEQRSSEKLSSQLSSEDIKDEPSEAQDTEEAVIAVDGLEAMMNELKQYDNQSDACDPEAESVENGDHSKDMTDEDLKPGSPIDKDGPEDKADDAKSDEEGTRDEDKQENEFDPTDFVVLDEETEENDVGSKGGRNYGDRSHKDKPPLKGTWQWKRTFDAIDRSLKLELPGVRPFNRPPRGIDHHPRAKEPHFRRTFEEMRNSCHGYITYQSPAMKAAVTWYNRTVKEPQMRLSVMLERPAPPGPRRGAVRESDIALSPASFSLMHPFVWSDESSFSLGPGVAQVLPRAVVKDWDNRSPELAAMENVSVQLRRCAQLQAQIFGELQKLMSQANEGETVGELTKKIQPAMNDLSDLSYFLCNRTTALTGLAAKASRRVVIDSLGIPQEQVNTALYTQLGSPLFTELDATKLLNMSPRYDRRGNPRDFGPARELPERRRYGDDYGTGTANVKRELVSEINRLISAARRMPERYDERDHDRGHERDRSRGIRSYGGGRGGPRRRSRSRSPVSRRRNDSRY